MTDPGREWGIASLFLAGIATLTALPGLILLRLLVESGFGATNLVVGIAGYLAAAAMGAVSITSVVFGVRELTEARRSGRPPALAIAGLLLGGIDVLAWSGISLGWHDAVTTFLF